MTRSIVEATNRELSGNRSNSAVSRYSAKLINQSIHIDPFDLIELRKIDGMTSNSINSSADVAVHRLPETQHNISSTANNCSNL